jgi:hypothetical protein
VSNENSNTKVSEELRFAYAQADLRVEDDLNGLRVPSCGAAVRSYLHRFEFGGDSSQAKTCRTHSQRFLKSTLLDRIGYQFIGDATKAKGRTAVDKSIAALMRERLSGSLGYYFTFPLDSASYPR